LGGSRGQKNWLVSLLAVLDATKLVGFSLAWGSKKGGSRKGSGRPLPKGPILGPFWASQEGFLGVKSLSSEKCVFLYFFLFLNVDISCSLSARVFLVNKSRPSIFLWFTGCWCQSTPKSQNCVEVFVCLRSHNTRKLAHGSHTQAMGCHGLEHVKNIFFERE
jgi:hypothetical protein